MIEIIFHNYFWMSVLVVYMILLPRGLIFRLMLMPPVFFIHGRCRNSALDAKYGSEFNVLGFRVYPSAVKGTIVPVCLMEIK